MSALSVHPDLPSLTLTIALPEDPSYVTLKGKRQNSSFSSNSEGGPLKILGCMWREPGKLWHSEEKRSMVKLRQ